MVQDGTQYSNKSDRQWSIELVAAVVGVWCAGLVQFECTLLLHIARDRAARTLGDYSTKFINRVRACYTGRVYCGSEPAGGLVPLHSWEPLESRTCW